MRKRETQIFFYCSVNLNFVYYADILHLPWLPQPGSSNGPPLLAVVEGLRPACDGTLFLPSPRAVAGCVRASGACSR